jgi:hypothetical protein
MIERPIFPNELRDLSPELTRIAVFVIVIGRRPEDRRPDADKSGPCCEGSRCVLPAREGAPPLALSIEPASLLNG